MPPPEPHRRRLTRRVKSAGILPATVMVLLTCWTSSVLPLKASTWMKTEIGGVGGEVTAWSAK